MTRYSLQTTDATAATRALSAVGKLGYPAHDLGNQRPVLGMYKRESLLVGRLELPVN